MNKKVCLILNNAEHIPKVGEVWECFKWVENEKYILVNPFKKIDENNLPFEKKRVDEFNEALQKLEIYLKKADFDKIIFDENNKPYLVSTLTLSETKKKYFKFIVKKLDNQVVARPIVTRDDSREWREIQLGI